MAPRRHEANYLPYMVPAAVLYLSSYLDMGDGTVILASRVAFGAVFLASLYVYILVRQSMEAINNTELVTYAPGGGGGGGKKKKGAAPASVTTTVREYEEGVLSKEITALLLGAGIAIAIHVAVGATVSILVGAATGPFTLYNSPLVRAHLLGEDLTRPFTEPETMMQSLKSEFAALKADVSSTMGASDAAAPTRSRIAADAVELFQRSRNGASAAAKPAAPGK